MARFIQCPKTNKLIPYDEYHRDEGSKGPLICGDIESFVSPVDGSTITTRSQLREHNKRHGVTDSRDYSADWFKRKKAERDSKLQGNTAAARQDRVAALQKEMAKRGM